MVPPRRALAWVERAFRTEWAAPKGAADQAGFPSFRSRVYRARRGLDGRQGRHPVISLRRRLAGSLLKLLLCTGLLTGAALLADDTMKKDDTMKSDSMKSAKMMTAKGTITKMDKDGKMMMMKNAKGKEMTMYWDDSTKVTGDMKEGSMATVHYMMSGGKMMAHDVMMHSDMKSDMKK